MRLLSFVIPCYCSQKTIAAVVWELVKIVGTRKDLFDYEIILVNDSSKDNTWEAICGLCEADPKIRGISFARNFGQHAAVMAGFAIAKGDLVVSLDDDGQTPVDELFSLVDKLDEGYDIVFAKYIEQGKRPFFRRLGTSGKEAMNEIVLGKPRDLVFNSFFIARAFVIEEVLRYTNPYPYLGGLLYRTSTNAANAEVLHRKRMYGSSTYTFNKLVRLLLNELTSFSVKPLRIATVLGLAVSLIGFIFILVVIIRKIAMPHISAGWSSTVSILLFVSGIQMIMMGLIGEYVGRIYISLNKTPQYVIKEKRNVESKKP